MTARAHAAVFLTIEPVLDHQIRCGFARLTIVSSRRPENSENLSQFTQIIGLVELAWLDSVRNAFLCRVLPDREAIGIVGDDCAVSDYFCIKLGCSLGIGKIRTTRSRMNPYAEQSPGVCLWLLFAGKMPIRSQRR